MKTKRQAKMLELIKRNDIETQEELSDYLEREGYQVTQATVSRDIRELKLTKVAMSNGRQKYVALQETDENLSQKYVRVFHDGFVSMDMAQNILVINDEAHHAWRKNPENKGKLTREQKEALKKFSETLGEGNYEKHRSFFGKKK